jgi:D-glycero-D-manno-heptose 1,7-bisphosphate phosphatase
VIDEEGLNEPRSQDGESGEEGSRSGAGMAERRTAPNRLRVQAVIFDRDETIVVDVPFNGDPSLVELAPNARELLDRLRAAGLPLAVVSNQSGIGRGFITQQQMEAVNQRIDELLGPFSGFFVCPHAPEDACDCRKPKPTLIFDAARALGVEPACCVVVGDRQSDVDAARNAGAIPLKIDGPSGLARAVETILYWTLESSSQ